MSVSSFLFSILPFSKTPTHPKASQANQAPGVWDRMGGGKGKGSSQVPELRGGKLGASRKVGCQRESLRNKEKKRINSKDLSLEGKTKGWSIMLRGLFGGPLWASPGGPPSVGWETLQGTTPSGRAMSCPFPSLGWPPPGCPQRQLFNRGSCCLLLVWVHLAPNFPVSIPAYPSIHSLL